MKTSFTSPARSPWLRVVGPNLLVLIGRGATGALPLAATAFASHAYGLAAMGGLATALMLGYATAEVADGLSQRHVSRLLGAGTSEAATAISAFNTVRVVVLAAGLLASAAIVRSIMPETGSWPFLVLVTAIWSTVANMDYAIALARDDYVAIGIGPAVGIVALFLGVWALEFISPDVGILNLCVALNVARLAELGWLRYRHDWPGLSLSVRAVIEQWRATRYLVAQALLSAFHVRLAVPLVASLGGVIAAGVFSIGLSLLSIVSLSAVAITVPAYRRAVSDGPVDDLLVAWQRTRRDFAFSLLLCSTLVLTLWVFAPWASRTIFGVHDAYVHVLIRVILLGGLFEALTLFASVWYHACVRDRELFRLSVVVAVGGWLGVAVGAMVADLPGMAWGFTLSRLGAVLLLYQGLWSSVAQSGQHRSADLSHRLPDCSTHDSRIRVLRIIARLNVGGPAIHVALLHERLDSHRYHSVVVAGTEEAAEGNYLDLHERPLANLVRLPGLGREIRGASDLMTLVALVRIMRRYQPTIVHTHTAKAGTLGRVAAWLCRAPVVVHTFHGHIFHGYFSRAKTRLFIRIERWLARRSSCLVAVSDRVRQDILALGIGEEERFRTIPLGFDLDPFLDAERHRGALKSELHLPDDVPLVGIVARLVPIKAHEIFLEAAVRLVAERPSVQFVIVGDGERREELEALAGQLGVARSVHFLGWRADLARVYADLDVVALTSRNEGSPVALIEAMAAARPVVATSVGGVPDVVSDDETGILVPPAEAPALAKAILRVLGDPALGVRLGEAARESVRRRYSADRLIRDIDELYVSLLDGTHSAPRAFTSPATSR